MGSGDKEKHAWLWPHSGYRHCHFKSLALEQFLPRNPWEEEEDGEEEEERDQQAPG